VVKKGCGIAEYNSQWHNIVKAVGIGSKYIEMVWRHELTVKAVI
jgi:hypothetical protein